MFKANASSRITAEDLADTLSEEEKKWLVGFFNRDEQVKAQMSSGKLSQENVLGKEVKTSLPRNRAVVPIAYDKTLLVKVRSPIMSGRKDEVEVIDLVEGKQKRLAVNVVLHNSLCGMYPNDGYVGRCFSIQKIRPSLGKTYAEFVVHEIRLAEDSARKLEQLEIFISTQKTEHEIKKKRGTALSREEYEALGDDWQDWYDRYLKSKRWKETIKPRILERDSKLCKRCGGRADFVHHRSYAYEVMFGHEDGQLVAICYGCHDFIHFDDEKRRRVADECDRLLLLRDESSEHPEPKIDLRKRGGIIYPSGWNRMSAMKKTAFMASARNILTLRRSKRRATKKS